MTELDGIPSVKKKLVIVSGLAGSGKTIVIRALEDLGYYCVDNLPSSLISSFAAALDLNEIDRPFLALALDSRDLGIVQELKKYLPRFEQTCDVDILFVEADIGVVLKRFRETRRLHPLSKQHNSSLETVGRNLQDAIKLDSEMLLPIRNMATRILNTTDSTAHYLRQLVSKYYSPHHSSLEIPVALVSFGFKHGLPADLDTMFDVRCFANPHYVEELRPLTGLNSKVRDFVFADVNVTPFVEKITDLMCFLYPLYLAEGKRYFGVGIGCTGGKHRSVAIAEELARRLRPSIPALRVEHRHFDRE